MENTVNKTSRFEKAVQSFLDALSSGITIVRRHRRRRREGKIKGGSTMEIEESQLNRSLKRSRADVSAMYKQHLTSLGRRFVKGDVKAKTSFVSILSRLNVGFASFLRKFNKGKYASSDIHALVNLSNSSRLDALKTFEQFSTRISQTSLKTPVLKPKPKSQRSLKGEKEFRRGGPASSLGKNHHKKTTVQSQHDRPPKSIAKMKVQSPKLVKSSSQKPKTPASSNLESPQDDAVDVVALSTQKAKHAKRQNRASMISFLSESTRMGEVVERNSANAMGDSSATQDYLADTAFPLSPWQKPLKLPSRFMRLFRKID